MHSQLSKNPKTELNVRADFPILAQPVVYLDSAATSQKPAAVIRTLEQFYKTTNANVHRGVYQWSAQATSLYEGARKKVAGFINAQPHEIVFVRNATEAVNLVSHSWAGYRLNKGDRILLTAMEHHSNIVPWQIAAKWKGAEIDYIPLTKEGTLDMTEAKKLLAKKPKLLALTHVSNVLGTINPINELITLAHAQGTKVLIDACQSVPHLPIDVKALDADFLVFSGHKLFAPSIGVLYAKEALLESMEPFLTGGDMVKEVTLANATWNAIPWKFEAGTPAVAEAVALGSAVDYLNAAGMENVQQHDQALIRYAQEQLAQIPGITIYGPRDASQRCGVVAFNLADVHPHDLASVLDERGVAVRSGHHCAMPLHAALGAPATCRMSIALYNTHEDIDALVTALREARSVFKL
jgi:cysteine desulfurase/selenocysteine lyase